MLRGTIKKFVLQDEMVLFWGIPLLIFLFPHLFLITGGYERWIMPADKEFGFIENATAFFFFVAGIYGFCLLKSSQIKNVPFFRVTLFLISILAIWISLEEISYGQHFLRFGTSEWFLKHNYNKEMNVHNLAKDNVSHTMRTLSYIVVILMGIIAIFIIRLAKLKFSNKSWFYYFIPSAWMVSPSLFYLLANSPKKILMYLLGSDTPIVKHYYFSASGEYEEYMFGVWVILYIVMIHRNVLKSEENCNS